MSIDSNGRSKLEECFKPACVRHTRARARIPVNESKRQDEIKRNQSVIMIINKMCKNRGPIRQTDRQQIKEHDAVSLIYTLDTG